MKKTKIPGVILMTPKEVAEKSSKSLDWIRKNIQSGRLEATNVGGRYFVTPDQYDNWMKNQRPTGRPKKQGNA